MNNHAATFFQDLLQKIGNDLNVMMLGKVDSYDSSKNIAKIIPLHTIPDQDKEYPPLVNVPVGFFSIGGYSIKVQPKSGDIFLILFFDYDIDNVLINGESKTQLTDRTHDLNDAIALPLSINFLNNTFNATQDLTIGKEGTNAYVKITQDGNIVLNGSKIYAGEGANQPVVLSGGSNSSVLYSK